MLAGEAAPAERTVAVVKEHRAHDILDIGREDEAFGRVALILRDFRVARVKDGLHEGVAVVKEVGAALHELLNQVEVLRQGLIDQFDKLLSVLGEETRSLLKADALRAVAAVVRNVAGGLVGEKFDLLVVIDRVLQEIHDVAVERNRHGLLLLEGFVCKAERFLGGLGDFGDPALAVSGLDAGIVDFRDNADTARNLDCLRLCAAHAAETAGHKEVACEIAVRRNAEIFSACVQDGVEGAVDNALRADVHPAACGHLTVARAAHRGDPGPVL